MTGRKLPILALNSGSSSLKFGLYEVDRAGARRLIADKVELGGGTSQSTAGALARIQAVLQERDLPAPAAVGHRVVHGGPNLRSHCLIDDAALAKLKAATPFAPLHVPAALEVIRYAEEHFPGIPQVACFDTTFHRDMPEEARVFPIPRTMSSEGVQRYGFHGLSCESIVRQLGQDLPPRLVIAHLGNGASVTAVKDGRSVDTSMGLTPTGGVIMGTRSGDLDPGVLIYLARRHNLGPDQLEGLVDHKSGLLGISGVASDMRRLHAAAVSNDDARLAIAMFCYSVRKQIAAMTAALQGVDMLVLTGGIGENDDVVRRMICGGLLWLGLAPEMMRVLPTQEDEEIARHAWDLISDL